LLLLCVWAATASAQTPNGAFAKVELSFQLPAIPGNPFDHVENDVQATFRLPDGRSVTVPAFFDGDNTWRVRYTPAQAGRAHRCPHNAQRSIVAAAGIGATLVSGSGRPGPGFVRRDPATFARFRFDNGQAYYPLGHNVAWKSGDTPDVPKSSPRWALSAKTGRACG
jgi:hypothetical protein